MKIPNVSSMFRWLNNFMPAAPNTSQDFLQLVRQSDGQILGWIDEKGELQGSLAVSIPVEDADPASIWLEDDFVNNFNGSSQSSPLGGLSWIPNLGASCYVYQVSGQPPNMGAVLLLPPPTEYDQQNVGITLALSQNTATGPAQGFPLTLNTGWEATFIFRWPQYVGTNFENDPNSFKQKRLYLGFAFDGTDNAVSFTYGRPSKFIGLRYDTDTTSPAIADTTYHFECFQNSASGSNVQGTTGGVFNTGIVPDNNWHRFTMRSIVQGEILFSIDGGTEQMISMSTESAQGTGLSITTYGPPYVSSGYTAFAASSASSPISGAGLVVSGSNYPTNNGAWTLADFPVASSALSACTSSLLTGSGSGFPSGVTQETNNANLKFAWYNSFSPVIIFGNDSQSLPPLGSLLVDYFSFVYNPRLALDFNQSANPTLPRFFAPQT